jgi:predicted dehydrogenase
MAKKAVRKKKSTATKRNSKSSSPRRTQEKLKIALVGCGAMGHVHANWMVDVPEMEVVALCDASKDAIKRINHAVFEAKKLKPKQYTSFDKLLDTEQLDGIILVTPHTLHYPQITKALEHGVHVLTDKPMVTDAEHARKLTALQRETGLVLGVAFNAPHSAEYPYIKNVLTRGELGEIQLVDAYVCQNWLHWTRGTWRQNPSLSGGGMLYDSGAHMLNAMMWLVDSPVKRVYAMFDYRDSKVEINSVATIAFENGCMGSIACTGNAVYGIDSKLRLYGTTGTITTGVWGRELEHYRGETDLVKYPYVPYEFVSPPQNFVNAILGRDEILIPPRFGILLAELMDALYESGETGVPVDVRHREKPAS